MGTARLLSDANKADEHRGLDLARRSGQRVAL